MQDEHIQLMNKGNLSVKNNKIGPSDTKNNLNEPNKLE